MVSVPYVPYPGPYITRLYLYLVSGSKLNLTSIIASRLLPILSAVIKPPYHGPPYLTGHVL